MKKQAELVTSVIWPWKLMEYVAYLIVFVTPLYVNFNFWYPFGSSKILIVTAGVSIMAILYIWGLLISKSFFFRVTPLHIALGVFLLILTISSIFGVDSHNSFFGAFDFPTNLIYIYIVSIFALFVGFLANQNKEFIPKILFVSFASSVIVAFFSYSGSAIISKFSDYSSTIGNSSYAGGYLLFNILFGLALFIYHRNYWRKAFLLLGTLFILFSPIFFNINIFLGSVKLSQLFNNPYLFLGVANGAVLGLSVSVLIVIIFYLIKSSKKYLKISGIILLFAFMIGSVYISHNFVDPTSKIHQVYSEQKGENRFIAWGIARESFSDRPLLGSGFNNYYFNFQKYLTADIYATNVEFLFQPHNVIWEYLSNNGLLGLISYLSLLVFALLSLFRQKKDEILSDDEDRYKVFRIVLIGIIFGYFVQNLFVFDTATTYLMLFLVIGLSLGLSVKSWTYQFSSRKLIVKVIGSLIILANIGIIILFVIQPWSESKKWRQAAISNNLKELSSLRQNLQETSLYGGVGDSAYLATKLFNFYVVNTDKINDSNRELFLKEIDSLIAQVERDQLKQPENYRATLIIGKLYSLRMFVTGKLDNTIWDKANSYLDRTLAINDQSPEVHLAKAQLYIYKKNYVRARESVVQALTLVPNYQASYKIGNRLETLSPDKEFAKYLADMEAKYLPKP